MRDVGDLEAFFGGRLHNDGTVEAAFAARGVRTAATTVATLRSTSWTSRTPVAVRCALRRRSARVAS